MIDPTGHCAKYLCPIGLTGPTPCPVCDKNASPEPTPGPGPTPGPAPTLAPVPGPEPWIEPSLIPEMEHIFIKLGKYTEAFWNSINVDIGIGGGIGGSAKVYKLLKLEGIIKVDWWHWQLNDGKSDFGWKEKLAAGGAITEFAHLGVYHSEFKSNKSGKRTVEEGYTGNISYGFEYYYGVGTEVNIDFSLNEFYEEIKRIEFGAK